MAAFLLRAQEYGVPFKATAGLHHPIRGIDPSSGLLMHGFLNLLAAAIAARQGADRAELEALLDERDSNAFRITAEEFVWHSGRAGAAEVAEMRAAGFHSYGSCSFSEPIDDLISLGVLLVSAAQV
ncbi:MAG: hypothetical protein JOZ97_00125 [Candidatus Eremiobacteraeota bacterium]|nr:hypothetical protein [Candidatus Eremiobacteraeota bacterium]